MGICRRTEDGLREKQPKRTKKMKRQHQYHSSSEESDSPSDIEAETKAAQPNPSDSDSNSESEAADLEASDPEEASDLEGESSAAPHAKRKRNDPAAFATSISKILSSKLTTTKRTDPVLARSASATAASSALLDARLASKARSKLREEKKAALDRGRVKDVLGVDTTETSSAAAVGAVEKRLKKTAQRGVIKLFNAVRAAQVKAEEAAREARKEGVVGMQKREERVVEMSKQGFLDMIASGGKKKEGSVEV